MIVSSPVKDPVTGFLKFDNVKMSCRQINGSVPDTYNSLWQHIKHNDAHYVTEVQYDTVKKMLQVKILDSPDSQDKLINKTINLSVVQMSRLFFYLGTKICGYEIIAITKNGTKCSFFFYYNIEELNAGTTSLYHDMFETIATDTYESDQSVIVDQRIDENPFFQIDIIEDDIEEEETETDNNINLNAIGEQEENHNYPKSVKLRLSPTTQDDDDSLEEENDIDITNKALQNVESIKSSSEKIYTQYQRTQQMMEQFDNTLNKMKQNKAQVEELTWSLHEQEKANERYQKTITTLENVIQEKNDNITSLQNQITEDEISINQRDNTIDQLNDQIINITSHNETLENNLEELQNVIESFITEKQELEEQIKQAQDQAEEDKRVYQNSMMRNAEKQTRLKEQCEKHKKEIEELQESNGDLTRELIETKAEVDTLDASLNNANKLLTDAYSRCQDLEEYIKNSNIRIEQIMGQYGETITLPQPTLTTQPEPESEPEPQNTDQPNQTPMFEEFITTNNEEMEAPEPEPEPEVDVETETEIINPDNTEHENSENTIESTNDKTTTLDNEQEELNDNDFDFDTVEDSLPETELDFTSETTSQTEEASQKETKKQGFFSRFKNKKDKSNLTKEPSFPSTTSSMERLAEHNVF